jgi:hypothetical protein
MKINGILLVIIISALFLSACGGISTNSQNNGNNEVMQEEQTSSQNSQSSDNAIDNQENNQEENSGSVAVQSTPMPVDFATFFSLEYENALSSRNQLGIGILKLKDTPFPISIEQSKALLPLWQAILALESNPGTAQEEINAVQNQILTTLTVDQLDEILAMQLTNDDMIEVYNELGLSIQVNSEGTTMGSGQGGGTGNGSGLDTVSREATRTAAAAIGTPVGGDGGQGQNNKNQLTIAIINFLTELVNN